MTKPIMVIIDEAKWCRVEARVGDRYCALGYTLVAAGVAFRDSIHGHVLANSILGTRAADGIWAANDHLTGDARKLELTRLFREQGMVLCFVDSSKARVVEEPVMGCSWVTA